MAKPKAVYDHTITHQVTSRTHVTSEKRHEPLCKCSLLYPININYTSLRSYEHNAGNTATQKNADLNVQDI